MSANTVGHVQQGVTVTQVAGTELTVMNDHEARWYEQARDTYLQQTKYTEQTDEADLDRVLFFELMIYRLTQWLSSGKDYEGHLITDDEKQHRNDIRYFSSELTKLKSSMGLDKSSRDAAKNLDSPAEFIAQLKRNARQFGVASAGMTSP